MNVKEVKRGSTSLLSTFGVVELCDGVEEDAAVAEGGDAERVEVALVHELDGELAVVAHLCKACAVRLAQPALAAPSPVGARGRVAVGSTQRHSSSWATRRSTSSAMIRAFSCLIFLLFGCLMSLMRGESTEKSNVNKTNSSC